METERVRAVHIEQQRLDAEQKRVVEEARLKAEQIRAVAAEAERLRCIEVERKVMFIVLY